MMLSSQDLDGCDTGVATVYMSDVADSGPRNCQADCVYAQMQEKLGRTLPTSHNYISNGPKFPQITEFD